MSRSESVLRARGRRARTLLVLLAAACTDGVGPGELSVTRFDPPADYEVWWEEMKACTGRLDADFRRLRFFRVDAPLSDGGTAFPCDDAGTMCPAYWEWPHDIYLAAGVVHSEWFVKHEMLHDLHGGGPEVRVESCLRTPLPF